VLAPGLYEADDAEPKPGTEGNTISQMLTWIKNNGTADTTYTLVLGGNEELNEDFSIGASTTGYTSIIKNNVTIILQTSGTPVTITKGTGNARAMFDLKGANGTNTPTLILENGITLTLKDGITNQTSSLIYVRAYGKFVMRNGSKITNNIMSYANGSAGVDTAANGEFLMEGGEICNNTNTHNTAKGGGVSNLGTFTMKGGKIYNNTAGNETTATYPYGGGVYNSGVFNFEGGEISGNKALSKSGQSNYESTGGGVYSNKTFVMKVTDAMNPPLVKNNEAKFGGGLAIITNSICTIEGGFITGNKASRAGAGMFIAGTNITFSKTGGIIYGTASGTDSNCASDTPATNPHLHGGTATIHAIQICSVYSGSAVTYTYYRNDTHEGDGLAYTASSPSEQTGFIAEE
jgi:hypothetical protein